MENAKVVSCPLAAHFKLSRKQCPTTDEQKKEMHHVPYASAVGSLMYAMVCTRPDIAHVVSTVSRFMSNPGIPHWEDVKWILRYLRGSTNLKLCFGDGEAKLIAFSDSDMAGDVFFDYVLQGTWLEMLTEGSLLQVTWLPMQGGRVMAKQAAKVCGTEYN